MKNDRIEKCVRLHDGSMMSWGRKKMDVQSNTGVLAATFRTQSYDGDDVSGNPPAVTVTISSPKSHGTAFAVYNIEVTKEDRRGSKTTRIVVHALNVTGGVPPGIEFWCSFVAIGKPLRASNQTTKTPSRRKLRGKAPTVRRKTRPR